MKKLVLSALAVASAASIMAVEIKKPAASNGDKPNREQIQEAIYRQTGGKIAVPGSQQGKIVYVNCQKRAAVEALKENAASFIKQTHFAIEVQDGAFTFPNPKVEGNASLFVIDDPAMPALLSAPEDKWAMVNVAKLAVGAGEKPAFFNARVQKELTRGFCLLAGAQNSNYPMSLTGPVTRVEDLDNFADCRLPVDILNRFKPYMEGLGVKPEVLQTYRKACKEGWAPQPTNDVQKAIWSDVHQLPTKPIKIEFDPAKDKDAK